MRCGDVMKTGIEAFREDDSIQVIAMRMRDVGTGYVPICDLAGRPVGIVTDFGIVKWVCADDRLASTVQAADVMEPHAPTCFDTDAVSRAEELMSEVHRTRILVCEERTQKLLGVLTLADVLRAEDEHRGFEMARELVESEYHA